MTQSILGSIKSTAIATVSNSFDNINVLGILTNHLNVNNIDEKILWL